MCRLLLTSLMLVLVLEAAIENTSKDFIAVNTLPDGEVETRIQYRGISAKETTVGRGKTGIKFRQLSDGNRIIQLIYDDNDDIKDCEFLHQREQVNMFLTTFKKEINQLITTSNLTILNLDNNNNLPSDIKRWLSYKDLKNLCRKRHREMKNVLHKLNKRDEGNRLQMRKKRFTFVMPGTHWCGYKNDAARYTDVGLFSRTDMCCRRHDHCRRNIPGYTKKYNYYNHSPYTLSHCFCDKRQRRDVSDLLRVPGTKWCGKGYSAEKYTRLGGFSKTDKCCRMHDTGCPFWIAGFQTKYGLFNWRVNTIMHCSCDERFRTCLKLVDTSDANLVGKIFFNVVQTQCFVLKPKKFCARRSWWGKCEKIKYVKQAVLRNNIPY